MKKFLPLLLAMSALLLPPTGVQAHEFLLKPAFPPIAKKSSLCSGQVQAAHVFMVSEEAERLADVALSLAAPHEEVQVEVDDGKKQLSLDYSFISPTDGPFILVGWRKPQLWSETTQGWLEGGRSSLQKQGKTVLNSSMNEKFCKVFYNLTADAEKNFAKPVGHKLEIIPLGDVAKASANSAPMPFQVLLDGKPLSVPIKATFDGFSREEEVYAHEFQPDDKAVTNVSFSEKGLWMLRAETTTESQSPDADTHNLKAVLIFAVP